MCNQIKNSAAYYWSGKTGIDRSNIGFKMKGSGHPRIMKKRGHPRVIRFTIVRELFKASW